MNVSQLNSVLSFVFIILFEATIAGVSMLKLDTPDR